MKAITAIVVLLLLLVAAAPALAQQGVQRMQGAPADTSGQERSRGVMPLTLSSSQKPAADRMGLLQSRMMEEAMDDPIRRSVVLVYGLPTFGAPLGLSEDQIDRLRQGQAAYLAVLLPLQQRAEQAGQQLGQEMAKPSPDPERVRLLLREQAFQQSDVKALAFEVAAGMLDALTPAQHQALGDLDAAALHHHLKTHLTAEELVQAMGGPAKAGLPPAPPPK